MVDDGPQIITVPLDYLILMQSQIKESSVMLALLRSDMHDMKTDIAVLKERSDHALANCPQRERIKGTENGISNLSNDVSEMRVQLEKVYVLAQNNRLTLAQYGPIAGISASLGAIVAGVIQMLAH